MTGLYNGTGDRCPKCSAFMPYAIHGKCPCNVWHFSQYCGPNHDPDDWQEIQINALDAEDAAKMIHEANYENWDYSKGQELIVRKPGEEWQLFETEVEMEPTFSAEPMELPETFGQKSREINN